MKHALLILSWVLALYTQAPLAETVYKGTDAEGNTVYSDKPLPNGEKIDVAPVQTYSPPPQVMPSYQPQASSPATYAIPYQLSIASPADQTTYDSGVENVDVAVSLNTGLQKGDGIRILLNGVPTGEPTQARSFALGRLYRGEYKIQAEVVSVNDPNQVKAQSEPITIYQQRAVVRGGQGS
jgi:hypothetical protein